MTETQPQKLAKTCNKLLNDNHEPPSEVGPRFSINYYYYVLLNLKRRVYADSQYSKAKY